MSLLHATGVFFEGKGIILMGPSGVGKSDLALRLMARGAELVGDDYLEVTRQKMSCSATAPAKEGLMMCGAANIAGKIEVRAVGILDVPYREHAPVDMIFQLVPATDRESLARLPEEQTYILEDMAVPCLDLYSFEASAPEKISAALTILLKTPFSERSI